MGLLRDLAALSRAGRDSYDRLDVSATLANAQAQLDAAAALAPLTPPAQAAPRPGGPIRRL